MHTELLSDPVRPGADEDAAGVLGEVAVLLDGAGLPERFRAGCHHSVAWFSHTLAGHLLLAAQDPAVSLREALAAAIGQVAALHAGECALDEGGPSATVLAVRRRADVLEHVVLCDSSLLLVDKDGQVERRTDLRIDEVVREETAAVRQRGAAEQAGTAEAIEARRNAPGGFWVARHEPEAAAQALVGSTPLAQLDRVHLVSDGVTRAVDLLGTHDDERLARALGANPRELLAVLRHGERALLPAARPRKLHDDATVLTVRL